MPPTERPIKAELIYRMRDVLEKALRTDVPESDLSRASRVVIGKDTGDPYGVSVSIHDIHPLKESAENHDQSNESIRTGNVTSESAWRLPVESLGGSKFRRLSGTVQVRALVETTQAQIVTILETVKGRVIRALSTDTTLRGFTDQFGHTLFALDVEDIYGYASGGEDIASDRIWIDWAAQSAYARKEL